MFPLRKRILVLKVLSACIISKVKMADLCSSINSEELTNIKRFPSVEGIDNRTNDIIYHPPATSAVVTGKIIYFGGDVQDYPENMMSHRDNQRHVKWNLENTAKLLHQKFPSREILIIRPNRLHLKTFSCYENFVPGNDCGVPNHEMSPKAVAHLQNLLSSVQKLIQSELPETSTKHVDSLLLIGFSKGCVVLNQLLYSFMAVTSDESELWSFIQHIRVMCWLDGGHSGGSNTWVVDRAVLQRFASLGIDVHVHVTPYQIRCESRPWIGKEEQGFTKTLKRLGVNVFRQVHFEEEPRTLENHFQILENFSL